jgi:predicted amidohydrolase
MPDPIIVAAIQLEPRIGEPERNRRHSLEMIERAADQGATLVVLPELTNSGYVFDSLDEARSLAEHWQTGPSVTAWARIASARALTIVAGLCEADDDRIYNSAVAIGPNGPLGRFRKVHLWDQENRFFTPGDLGFPVIDTQSGRIGIAICYDGWFPESYRACALHGADVVCVPTNWVPMPDQPSDREVMANTLVIAAAHSNGLFIIAADRVGTERGQPFLGCSIIAGPTGFPIAGPASPVDEQILLAPIDLARAAAARRLNNYNHLLENRRPSQYQASCPTDSQRL